MAAHDDVEPALHRVHAELLQVMQNVDAPAVDLDGTRVREPLRPGVSVVVSADRVDRRERFELSQNLGAADIAGVQDELTPAKTRKRFRPELVMGVGDDPDERRHVTGARTPKDVRRQHRRLYHWP